MKTAIKISPVNMEERQKLGLKAGDTVKVSQKIQEKGKTRLQVFEGLILAVKHGSEAGGTFTVRKVASGVGVEKIFPIYSPLIDNIKIVKRSDVGRSKLYYIREKAAKEIKRQMKHTNFVAEDETSEDVAVAEVVEAEAPKEEAVKKDEGEKTEE